MKKRTIGVLSPLLDGFYFNGILQGIHQIAVEQHANLVLIQTMDSIMSKVTYQWHLAADYIDGWIIILNAVTDKEYVKRIELMQKPIICTPNLSDFGAATTFLLDNVLGGYMTTKHLIEHGHREIACIYTKINPESVDRFHGYIRALEEHGIPVDPIRIYEVDSLWEESGVAAAAEMRRRGFPLTAVTASSDMVAIGLMDVLRRWGKRVPEDIAVIGFDNLDLARRISLSSVNQPLFGRGMRMASRLLEEIEGLPTAGARHIFSETASLVLRHSCGCEPVNPSEGLVEIHQNGLETIDYLSSVIQRNHQIGRDLVKANSQNIKDLSWLSSTEYTWGCLALWSAEGRLQVESVYSKKMEPVLQKGELYEEGTFPPSSVYDMLTDEEVLSIYTIRTEARNWGFILLIGKVNDKNRTSNYQYDTMTHSLDLLAYALEREVMYENARERETRLEIVSSTTNDGIFDWDLASNTIAWNRKILRMLSTGGDTTMTTRDFFGRIHADDIEGLQEQFNLHLSDNEPFHTEFRLLSDEQSYIWVEAAGEVVRDADKQPVRMIGSIRDITERKEAEERIRYIAYHDALTDLPNRRYFNERIDKQIERTGASFALMLLDLDRFKLINDSLGHTAGDLLLQRVAAIITEQLRPEDTVARLGGDEFILLCPYVTDPQEPLRIAERIFAALSTRHMLNGHSVHVTCSMGVSLYPEHGQDHETLVRNADIAMYEAKSTGKNRIQIYREQMSVVSRDKLRMENCLRGALDSGEFELYYQPQYDVKGEQVIGMEALIRWFSPELGAVPPMSFIPLAEETGLINAITAWVLRTACLDNKRLLDAGFAPMLVSVNISALDFMEADFVSRVREIVEESGLPPHLLCLELTETAAIQNLELTIRQLRCLMDCGIKIALDDFGTGNSSLSLLKMLPLHRIKIDRSFVKDMAQQDANRAIFSTIVGLTRGLKLESCAEGIETEEQYEIIREMACSLVQGYYIAKPLPFGDFQRFLQA
ncbi:EAL domain-containing protein [Paenibacillus athensensis]|uniref:Diguanylate cyclase n=1 Tax=Paenibacillus athensensis TaxID=1967502 RepID=A0A4Y8QCI1_9BACL|nr:EAL domain-containing protein [Paenibacillus athensensis]MCD1257520.1 EAL domain-containing protein [Paenibacillus athensensis]